MAETIEVRVSHRFTASSERVYDAWLDPDKVRVWMQAAARRMGLAGDVRQVTIDPRVGGTFLFSDMRDGVETRHWGTYLELDRPSRIVFTWIVDEAEAADPGRVTLAIQPDGTGCVATIVHEMDAQWADYEAQTKNGWNCMLQATTTVIGD